MVTAGSTTRRGVRAREWQVKTLPTVAVGQGEDKCIRTSLLMRFLMLLREPD